MASLIPLPEKNNTSLLSSWIDRAVNFTYSLFGIAGEDYPREIHMNTGSWTSQSITLVYDDILRFDKGTYTGGTPITKDNFNYNTFHSNMLWWIDNLVGMESTWTQDALNTDKEGNTAYGYTQITEDTLPTALNRYTNHIDRYNKRHTPIPYPQWVVDSKTYLDQGESHIDIIDTLSYDQVCALTIVHAHTRLTNDFNWVKIQNADVDAAKSVYAKGHHTNPDGPTLKRMEKFWIVKKERAHTLLSKYRDQRFSKTCAFTETKTVDDVMDKLIEKTIFHNGEELQALYTTKYPSKITDTTGLFDPDYGKYANGVYNKILKPGTIYKGFRYSYSSSNMDYYFYRSGDSKYEFLKMVRSELSGDVTGLSYNYDELYDTIDSWPKVIDVYVLDWFVIDSTITNYLIPSLTPDPGFTAGFFVPNSVWHPNGHAVMGLSTGNRREQLITFFHELGGHGMHPPGKNWGGDFSSTIGDSSILTNVQVQSLVSLFKTYDNDRTIELNNIATQVGVAAASYHSNRQAYLNSIQVNGLSHSITKMLSTQKAKDYAEYERLIKLHGTMRHTYSGSLPMNNLRNLSSYKKDNIEEEFLSRIYAMMATNKCITFVEDIWPVLIKVLPNIGIDLATARRIDDVMRDDMKLDKRTYK
jgi:hypothetical protein